MQLHKRMLAGAALAAMVCAGAAQAQAPAGGASAQEVTELLNLLGTQNLVTNVDHAVAQRFARGMPCIPQATVQQAFDSPQVQQEQLGAMTQVYQRHFTSADIQGLLTFYRSSIGQKWLHEIPAVTQEYRQLAFRSGQQRVQAMVADLKKQGVLDAQGRCPAPRQAPLAPKH